MLFLLRINELLSNDSIASLNKSKGRYACLKESKNEIIISSFLPKYLLLLKKKQRRRRSFLNPEERKEWKRMNGLLWKKLNHESNNFVVFHCISFVRFCEPYTGERQTDTYTERETFIIFFFWTTPSIQAPPTDQARVLSV